jgi:hypothetical protein
METLILVVPVNAFVGILIVPLTDEALSFVLENTNSDDSKIPFLLKSIQTLYDSALELPYQPGVIVIVLDVPTAKFVAIAV